MTALTLLLVSGLSGTFSKWVILAIPFESAIFGLWWLDHAATIRKIGRYLADEVEEKIDATLGSSNVIDWERRVERSDQHGLKRVVKGYQSVSDWTFIWPSALVLVISFFGSVVTGRFWPEGGWRDDIADLVIRFFPLASEFERYRSPILLFSAAVGTLMLIRYLRQYHAFDGLVRQNWRGQSENNEE